MRWTEEAVLDAVEAHFLRAEPCQMVRQVEVEDRRLDALIVAASGQRIAIEAKCSRADFRSETDEKRRPAWRVANECWYAAPPNLIPHAEVPLGWGLLHVFPGGASILMYPYEHDRDPSLDRTLAQSLLWRTGATERRLRAPETPEERAAALSLDVERLEGVVGQRDVALARETKRAQDAVEQVMVLAGGAQRCSACDGPITYTRVHGWRHVDPEQEDACEAHRAEAERRRRETLTGAAYLPVPAPRVTPAGLPTPR